MAKEFFTKRVKPAAEQPTTAELPALSAQELAQLDTLAAMESLGDNKQLPPAELAAALAERVTAQAAKFSPADKDLAAKYRQMKGQQQRRQLLNATEQSGPDAKKIQQLEAGKPELVAWERMSALRDELINERRQSEAWRDASAGDEESRRQAKLAGGPQLDLRAAHRLDQPANKWRQQLEVTNQPDMETLRQLGAGAEALAEQSLDKLMERVEDLSPVVLRLAGQEYAKQAALNRRQLDSAHLTGQQAEHLRQALDRADRLVAERLRQLNRLLQEAEAPAEAARLKAALRLFSWRQPEKLAAYLAQHKPAAAAAWSAEAFWWQADLANRHDGWQPEQYQQLKGLEALRADKLEQWLKLSRDRGWRPTAKDKQAIKFYCQEIGREDLRHLTEELGTQDKANRLHQALQQLAAEWQTPSLNYLAEEIADLVLEREIESLESNELPKLDAWLAQLGAAVAKREKVAPAWLRLLFEKAWQYSWFDHPQFQQLVKRRGLDKHLHAWRRLQQDIKKTAS